MKKDKMKKLNESVANEIRLHLFHDLHGALRNCANAATMIEHENNKRHDQNQKIARWCQDIKQSVHQIDSLLEAGQNLDRRLNDQPKFGVFNTSNLVTAVKTVIQQFNFATKNHKLKIVDRTTGGKATYRTDLVLIQNCLTNLFMNAIHFSPRGSEIEIEIANTASEFVFSLANEANNTGSLDAKLWLKEGYSTNPLGIGYGLTVVDAICSKLDILLDISICDRAPLSQLVRAKISLKAETL